MTEFEELLRAAIIAILDVRIYIKNNNLGLNVLDECLEQAKTACSDEIYKRLE